MINADRPPRGFVTIATGSLHYYKLASNLLHSYRRNGGGAWPFAIIAEEENEYTKAFDQLVLMPNPTHSYMDKLRLFECLPYDEIIFIDADCLVYGCIDDWWSRFENGPAFSCFGCAIEDLNTDRGWFRWDGMGEFKDQIHFVPSFSGGVYYVRRTETAKRVFQLAHYGVEHYRDFPFAIFREPADEPVLAFGMAVCNCSLVDVSEVGIYVKRRDLPMDILVPTAHWTYKGRTFPVKLVHWGNFGTMKAQYMLEVERLDRDLAGKQQNTLAARLLYHTPLRYTTLLWHDGITLIKRIRFRARQLLRRRKRDRTLKRHSDLSEGVRT